MSEKREHYIETRATIAMLVEAIGRLGYNQKEILKHTEEHYNWSVQGGMLSKAKCIDKEKLDKNEYYQSRQVLSKIETMLGRMLWDQTNDAPDKLKLIESTLKKHEIDPSFLYKYALANTDGAIEGNDWLPEVIKYDYIMKRIGAKTGTKVLGFVFFLYAVIPYALSMLLGRWSGIDYGFSSSNVVLFAYPISAVPIMFIFMFYNAVPESLALFSKNVADLKSFQEIVRDSFRNLPKIAIAIWLLGLLYVVYVHLGYLGDGRISFLENDDGSPNLLYYINIILFEWHLFLILYLIAILLLAAKVLNTITRDFFSDDPRIIKKPLALTFLLPLGKPLSRVLIVLFFALLYALFFTLSMYNVSKDLEGILYFNWQLVEAVVIFCPLAIYVLVLYMYIKPIAQLHVGKEKVSFKQCKEVFIYLVLNNLIFLPQKKSDISKSAV